MYYVYCYESTGSSWDGTRRHWWTVGEYSGRGRFARLYGTRQEAEAVADEMTAGSVEP